MMSRMKLFVLLMTFLPLGFGCATDGSQAPARVESNAASSAEAVGAQGPTVRDISVRDEAESQVIDIEADRPLLFTMYKPSDPFQVVVELTAARFEGQVERILVDRDSILDIVPEQIETPSPMVRLEIGLTAPLTITPRVEGNHLLLDVPRLRPIGEEAEAMAAEEPVAAEEPAAEEMTAVETAEEPESVPAFEEPAGESGGAAAGAETGAAVAALAAELGAGGAAGEAGAAVSASDAEAYPAASVPEAAPLEDYPVPAEPAATVTGVPEARPLVDYPVPEGYTVPESRPEPAPEPEPAAMIAVAPEEPAPAAVAAGLTVRQVVMEPAGGNVVVRIDMDGEVTPEVYAIGGKKLILDLAGVETIARGSVETVLPPVTAIRTGMYRDKARVVIDLYKASGYDVTSDASGVRVVLPMPAPVVAAETPEDMGDEGVAALETVSRVPATEAPAGLPGEKPAEEREPAESKAYGGPVISLDFQDADVVQIYRLLADVAGYNLVVHPEVKGTIPSLKLENVPWDQALEIVLKLSGQGKVLEGNILRIAPPAVFASEQEAVVKTREARQKAEDLFQRIVAINYANAGEVRTAIEQSKILSPRGNITIDERMNTLVVQDVQSSIDKVLDLVRIMDVPKPQVLIESRMVTVRTTAAKDLGIDWSGTFNASADTGNPTGAYFPNSIVGSLATNVGLGQALPNFAVTLGSVDDLFTLNLQLAAIEESNDGRTLSNPRVLTMDNEEAEVKQGTKIPYKTVSDQGTQTSFVDATLSLKVTPRITPGGYVQLKILATRNAVGVNTPDGPSIDLNEVTTQALVKDGETVVVGGIYTKDTTARETKVPLVGDIPGFGWFFKSTTDTEEINELLIFITPRIVKGRVAL